MSDAKLIPVPRHILEVAREMAKLVYNSNRFGTLDEDAAQALMAWIDDALTHTNENAGGT